MSAVSTNTPVEEIGSTVSVQPTDYAPGKLPQDSPFAFPRPTDNAVRAAKILIVDSENANAQLVRDNLINTGFNSIEALATPSEALAKIEQLLPDLVLLDLGLNSDGLEALKHLRASELTLDTPILVLAHETSGISEDAVATALNLGANDVVTKPLNSRQLAARVRNALSFKINHDLLSDYSSKLATDVLRDSLTGMANRRAFEREIKHRISEWNRNQIPFCLLMIDLDNFEKINDLYSRRVGDAALCDVAKALATATRAVDLTTRYSGGTFAILLPKTANRESIAVAERIRQSIEKNVYSLEEQPVQLTVSVGLANAMLCDDTNLLVRRAEVALKSAKQNGRNCTYFHDGANCILLTKSDPQTGKSDEEQRDAAGDELLKPAKIAIVDDEPLTIEVAKVHLENAGFQHFVEISNSEKALETIYKEQPDLVLLDIRMPRVSGLEILKALRDGPVVPNTPVIIFTTDSETATKVTALNLGASDFLEKPVDASELSARVRNTLLAKSHVDRLAKYSSQLEREVCLRTTELSASRREAIQCLARAGELRDNETGQHVLRVGRYAAVIAEELGFSQERVDWMEHAAQLHDVGKIGVPDAILHKPGQLTEDEYKVMQAHCLAGTKIFAEELGSVDHLEVGVDIFEGCTSPMMKMASLVAQTHHEKWDGSGYPRGLAGAEIPIEGRIAAVADVFDALSTERAYKEAWALEECFNMLVDLSASHFDPDVLAAFIRRKADVIRIYQEHQDQ